jgi:hypothetical protein
MEMSEKKGFGFVGTLLGLWTGENGAVISAELVLVMTIAVLAMLVGLDSVSDAVNHELNDVAGAIGAISQSFNFNGIAHLRASGGSEHAIVAGSSFSDDVDDCDCIPLDSGIGHVATPPKCEDGN